MKQWIVVACIGLSLCLAGCGQRKAKQAARAPAAPQEAQQPAASNETEEAPAPARYAETRATSAGVDPLFMVNEALKGLIKHVGAGTVDAGPESMNFGFQAARALSGGDGRPKSPADAARLVQEAAFAEQILVLAKDIVADFKVASVTGPDAKGVYSISIEAKLVVRAAPAGAAKS